jgi:demethylmenaquinone methyltransferase / 2-methoxy-6-polyprenyl-1,4-benzoquinol methylase
MSATQPSSPVWSDALLADPHALPDKRTRVQLMFAAIAPSYDLNNRLHSFWMDQRWRSKAVELAGVRPDDVVVDVACGTGDLALHFAATHPRRVIGIDFTHQMLPLARRKSLAVDATTRSAPLQFINGDAMALPLPDACADIVSIAFGIRNVADPAKALRAFRRILRPGGRLVILEFSLPTRSLLRVLYNFYFRRILPRTATWISGDRTGAYKYLPESVNTFIDRDRMMSMMGDAGFEPVEQWPLTLGVCVCYRGLVRA